MKNEDLMLYFVENYINDEIEFNNEDLDYLENLTIDDKINIAKRVFDEELCNKINDNMNRYLYHYKYTKEEV